MRKQSQIKYDHRGNNVESRFFFFSFYKQPRPVKNPRNIKPFKKKSKKRVRAQLGGGEEH